MHPENKSVGRIPAGGIFDILKGPSCADGVVWWLVNYQGTIGWTGESMGTTYWFDPYGDSAPIPDPTPNSPASAGEVPTGKCDDTYLATQVKPKMQGIVNPDGKGNDMYTLPQLPSFNPNSKVVGYIPPGGIFDLLNGPWCDQGIVWWQVNYKGAVGWTGESDGKDYWFQPYVYVPG